MVKNASTDEGLDDAVRDAMERVYQKGFAAGRAAGFQEGCNAAREQIAHAIKLPLPMPPVTPSLPANSSIDELDLQVRTYNSLRRAGNSTIADVIELTDIDLVNVINFGTKATEDLDARLAVYGYVRRRA